MSSRLLLMVAKEVTVLMTNGGREAGRAIYRPERIELRLLKLVDTRWAAGRFPMAAGGRGARHAPERHGTCGRGQRRGKAAAGGACARRMVKGVALQRRRGQPVGGETVVARGGAPVCAEKKEEEDCGWTWL